jgi:hypothetical protein
MDPMATLHVGLVGAPALPVFVKRPKGFQMVAIVGHQPRASCYRHPRDRRGERPV